jgi:hypothetical protein
LGVLLQSKLGMHAMHSSDPRWVTIPQESSQLI